MAILPENLDYTSKDFNAIVARLNQLIESVEPTVDTETTTLLNLLKEMFAWCTDNVLFYQDNQALESLLPVARLRSSVLAHAQKLGYVPPGRTAATADVLIRLDSVPANDVQIPLGYPVRTALSSTQTTYQAITSATIAAGTNPPEATISVENSTSVTEELVSNGLANQVLFLTSGPYIDDSLTISTTAGVFVHANRSGIKTTNFFDSSPTDRHFVVTVDESGRGRVQFGDGVNGQIPTGILVASYKTGGGRAGRVGPNTLVNLPASLSDTVGNVVSATATNISPSSGGTDAESTADIRVKAPRSLRVSDRTVSREDYEIGATSVPGVVRSLMLTSDQFAGIPENTGYLYIVPDGLGAPSASLKAQVLQQVTVTKPNTITFRTEVRDPVYVTIDISVRAFRRDGFTGSQMAANIRQALVDLFALTNADESINENIDFGTVGKTEDGTLSSEVALIGDIVNAILEGANGVRKIGTNSTDLTINGIHGDVTIQPYEFPLLGTVTVIDGDTGEPL
jgi:hypothetical protein